MSPRYTLRDFGGWGLRVGQHRSGRRGDAARRGGPGGAHRGPPVVVAVDDAHSSAGLLNAIADRNGHPLARSGSDRRAWEWGSGTSPGPVGRRRTVEPARWGRRAGSGLDDQDLFGRNAAARPTIPRTTRRPAANQPLLGSSIVTVFASAHTPTIARNAHPRLSATTSVACPFIDAPPHCPRSRWRAAPARRRPNQQIPDRSGVLGLAYATPVFAEHDRVARVDLYLGPDVDPEGTTTVRLPASRLICTSLLCPAKSTATPPCGCSGGASHRPGDRNPGSAPRAERHVSSGMNVRRLTMMMFFCWSLTLLRFMYVLRLLYC